MRVYAIVYFDERSNACEPGCIVTRKKYAKKAIREWVEEQEDYRLWRIAKNGLSATKGYHDVKAMPYELDRGFGKAA